MRSGEWGSTRAETVNRTNQPERKWTMEFTPFTAAQYRALSSDELEKRQAEVIGIMSADTLPDGVTDDQLFEEADLITAEINRRNKANSYRAAKLDAVAAGAGTVIAKSDNAAKPTAEVKEVTDYRGFTESIEYRKALARHISGVEQMPASMAMKALGERQQRANTSVEMNEAYTNMTDTFENTISGLVIAPLELSDEVIREVKEQSALLDKVNQTFVQGTYAVSELDLIATGAWIGDKEVSPYQEEYDPEVFTWTWHQFECRFARTFLAEAIMRDNYKAQLAPAMADCWSRAIDAAILAGNGTTQPKGITNDVRLVGSDGKGKTTDGTPATVGKALVVNVDADMVDDWKFWSSLLWNENFNRLYRNSGELIMADGTWGNHLMLLHDQIDRPIANIDPLNQENPMTLRGVGRVSTIANGVMETFDSAESGDVIGIYGNFRNYTLNFQPGMPLTTTTWADHETNTNKTKLLVACDGRVSNPFGWIILKKYVSG